MVDENVPDTVKVSPQTYRDLVSIKKRFGLKSLDAAMREAIHRSRVGTEDQTETDQDTIKAK